MNEPHHSRRELLRRASTGFGLVALSGLMASPAFAGLARRTGAARPRRRAKRVIFCFMSGGVSHVDSFDPKPELERLHGQPMPVSVERTQFNQNGSVLASPFKFTRHGESGMSVSSMFPQIATVADELAVVREQPNTV